MEKSFDKDRLNMAEQIAQIGYFEMDIVSEKIICSSGAQKILKLKPNKSFSFNDLVNLIHPNDIGRVHRASIQAINKHSIFRLEFRLGHQINQLVHILANGRVKLNKEGKASTVLWSIQDITKQKAYEEAIELSEARLKYAERIANLGNFEWNLRTNEFLISDEIYRILGLNPTDYEGTIDGFLQYVHPKDLPQVQIEKKNKELRMKDNTRPVSFRIKTVNHKKTKHIYSKGETILGPDGKPDKRIGILMDVTRQVKLEAKLKKANKKKLKLIAQREKIGTEAIIFGQEDERQRMSMEIHDGLGQILTAVYFNLNHLESLTEPYENKEVEKSLNEIFELLQKSRTSIRAIANNLMPQVLMKFGLLGAIQALVDELFAATPIKIYLKAPDSKLRYEQSQEISIYRIIQELLNNTVKHSKSSEVNLRISICRNLLHIYLSDNGIGYDLQNAETSQLSSKGVSNIRQRIKFLSGSLTSKISNGSRVFIQIPLIPKL